MAIFHRSILALFLAAVVAVSAEHDVHDLATPFEEGNNDVDISAGGDNTFRGSSSNFVLPKGRNLGTEQVMMMGMMMDGPTGPSEGMMGMMMGGATGAPPPVGGKKGAAGTGVLADMSLSMPSLGGKRGGKRSDRNVICSIDFISETGMAAIEAAAAVEEAAVNTTDVIEGRQFPIMGQCNPCSNLAMMTEPEGIVSVGDALALLPGMPINLPVEIEVSCGCFSALGNLPIWDIPSCVAYVGAFGIISLAQGNPCGCEPIMRA